jgi:hypothetical protein
VTTLTLVIKKAIPAFVAILPFALIFAASAWTDGAGLLCRKFLK